MPSRKANFRNGEKAEQRSKKGWSAGEMKILRPFLGCVKDDSERVLVFRVQLCMSDVYLVRGPAPGVAERV